MVKILKYALILTVILTVLAVGAGLAQRPKFDNWAAVAAFFYAGEVIGAVMLYLMLVFFTRRSPH